MPYISSYLGTVRTAQGLPRFSSFLSYVPLLLRRGMREEHAPVKTLSLWQPSPIDEKLGIPISQNMPGTTFTALPLDSSTYGPHFA